MKVLRNFTKSWLKRDPDIRALLTELGQKTSLVANPKQITRSFDL